MHPDVEATRHLDGLRRVMAEASAAMPDHVAFVERHCRADAPS
jgi:hypothetical protein